MNSPKPKSLLRRLLKIVLLSLVLLIAAATLSAWVMRDKIESLVLDTAESRLAEEGIFIKRASHEWSMPLGVTLKQVELFSDREMHNPLAHFDHIGIHLPLADLLHRTTTLHFRAHDSGLTLDTSAGKLRVDQVNFSMTYTQRELSIHHLDSRLRNLHVTASGLVRWPTIKSEKAFKLPDLSPLVKGASWLDFPQGAPTLALKIHSTPENGVDLTGHLTGRHFSWRTLSFARADVQAVLASGTVKIPSLDVDCYRGNLKAALTVDYAAGLLKVGNVTSSVDPFRLVDGILGGDSLKSFQSLGTTTLSGRNLTFNTKDFSRSTGVLKATSPAGLMIGVASNKVALKDFHGSVEFADENLIIAGSSFMIHGGTGEGTYRMPLHGPFSYQLRMETHGMSADSIGQAFAVKGTPTGRINVSFDGGGATHLKSHFGNGQVKVMDGNFYSIPLFGSLRAMLTQQSTTFGVDHAKNLNCSYSLRDGIISSDDLRIDSASTKLLANGQVNLVQRTLDVDVRANLRGIAGVATGVVSHIFELHGEGPLNDVHWKMANAPGIVSGAAKVTTEGVKAATQGAGKVIGGIGGAASKIFGGRPGSRIPKARPQNKE